MKPITFKYINLSVSFLSLIFLISCIGPTSNANKKLKKMMTRPSDPIAAKHYDNFMNKTNSYGRFSSGAYKIELKEKDLRRAIVGKNTLTMYYAGKWDGEQWNEISMPDISPELWDKIFHKIEKLANTLEESHSSFNPFKSRDSRETYLHAILALSPNFDRGNKNRLATLKKVIKENYKQKKDYFDKGFYNEIYVDLSFNWSDYFFKPYMDGSEKRIALVVMDKGYADGSSLFGPQLSRSDCTGYLIFDLEGHLLREGHGFL